MSLTRLGVGVPLAPRAFLRKPARRLPFPLDQTGVLRFSRARHGLWQGIQRLGLPAGAQMLMPAFHCGAEVEALRQAGVECRFYETSETLEPTEAELEGLLDEHVAGLYLIHTLGFPQRAEHWRRWCDQRGLLLVEDAAQGWLATSAERPVGSFGDLAIFALYKSIPTPDGAVLLMGPRQTDDSISARRRLRGPLGLSGAARKQLEWLRSRSALAATMVDQLRPEAVLATGAGQRQSFALGDPDSRPSKASDYLLPRVVSTAVAESRRQNYSRLLAGLAPFVPPPFHRLAEGACPWGFPVRATAADRLISDLLRQRIRAVNLWPVPHPDLPADRFPGAERLRRELVILPVHQDLSDSDLQRIIAAVSGAAPALRYGDCAGIRAAQ